jgi:hypothetical protein
MTPVTMTSDTYRASGRHSRRVFGAGRAVVGAAVALVIGTGAASWWLAGSLGDVPDLAPPACPASVASIGSSGRAGDPDRLVAVPQPEPRGPITSRLCEYPADRAAGPVRQVVLDPPRTTALAGVLNAAGTASAQGRRPDGCPAGSTVTLAVFRYTAGPPLFVEVYGGPCALIASTARVELGRVDAVRWVAGALTGSA